MELEAEAPLLEARRTIGAATQPEKALALAVLENALSEMRFGASPDYRQRRLAADAQFWLFHEDVGDQVMSAVWVTNVLDLELATIREASRRQLGVAEMSREDCLSGAEATRKYAMIPAPPPGRPRKIETEGLVERGALPPATREPAGPVELIRMMQAIYVAAWMQRRAERAAVPRPPKRRRVRTQLRVDASAEPAIDAHA